MSDDFLEWARKQYENWLFNAITSEEAIKSLLPKQGEKIDIPMLPEPAPKHDGNLGDGEFVRYHYFTDHTAKIVCDSGELTPAQALSLLAWLKQKEAELQRLAKEQEG